ncbi:hydroxyacid dehydrogenase [Cryobacterium levicorallinum]|uniref:Hydroxyacid dehydrogenase n=1 Tax=Cryobacterium levicorallinum TaxID=995038 RepID=A0A1I3DWR4_9MICO|nr:2-hydroxyacid dehydrogenase [Cryobacterium levicorallinum]TFB83964.1 hydroxyacid dehydrogenase [Cryobacterium levicorallinum]GEP28638.1 dehydrogenase [Cryobacterium levicorallinum]SFH91039.1 Phosphoglycerate dehydrogenase [Cryobacterium levicorallinum]
MSSETLRVSLPDPDLRAALGELPDGVEVIEWAMEGPAPIPKIDLVVTPYMGAANRVAHLAGVRTRLVQSQSIGYDGIDTLLPAGHVFANAASVHETSTAELTLALILASQRGIDDFVRAAERGEWAPAQHASLADRTVLLLGYGGVGHAIETRLLAFETTVIRVARTARTDERGTIYGFESLPELLSRADIVVVGVPLTPETTGMVDDAFLSLMPGGALLVNIARGPVADTEALLAHATSGRIRLALDVTDPEPLPAGHPLFALPNVIISPHVGGASSAMLPRMALLVRQQIERMLRGETPINVVLTS